jgi:Holliday junction resolvase RusA-like endonuclease
MKNKKKELLIELLLPVPISDNHLFGQKGRMRFMYSEGKRWKDEVQIYAKIFYKGEVLESKLRSDIYMYVKRDRDLHGSLKLMYDAFQGIIYKNDSQFVEEHLYKLVDKEDPRIIFKITEL